MPRFTLTSLLLLVTVLALACTLIVNNNQWREERAELEELRGIAGRLVVSDITQVHATPVPTTAPLTWRWQIYLPPDKRYRLAIGNAELQKDDTRAIEAEHHGDSARFKNPMVD